MIETRLSSWSLLALLVPLLGCQRGEKEPPSERAAVGSATASSATASKRAAPEVVLPCPVVEPRLHACEAEVFQNGWDTTAPESLSQAFPPGAKFRLSGAVAEVRSGGGKPSVVYLQAGAKRIALGFAATSAERTKLSAVKAGARFTAICEFAGRVEGGVITLDRCAL